MDVLSGLGAPEKNIYYDKFTTTGPPDAPRARRTDMTTEADH